MVLQTTGLKPQTIASGLMGAALFRLRVPLALAIAATPLIVVSRFQDDLSLTRRGCVVFVSPDEISTLDIVQMRQMTGPCVEPDDPRVIWNWLNLLPGMVTVAGGIILANVLGVTLTLWLRSPLGAAAGAVGIIVFIIAALTVIGPHFGRVYIGCTSTCIIGVIWPPAGLVYGFVIPPIPYALAWIAMRTVRIRPAV